MLPRCGLPSVGQRRMLRGPFLAGAQLLSWVQTGPPSCVHPAAGAGLWGQERLRAPLAFIVTGTWSSHWGSSFPLFLVLAPF